MQNFGLKGTLKVFGAPAEEQLLSRPYFVRDGYFDDVDVAFHDHIGGDFSAAYGLTHSALISAKFTFHGETAHAAVAPWNGNDALDAVVLMDVGMAQYREHMRPDMRVCRVITEGGDQPNVIPRTRRIWWYFRDPTAEGALKLFEQAKKIAARRRADDQHHGRGRRHQRGVAGARQSELAEVLQRNIEPSACRSGPRKRTRSRARLQTKAKVQGRRAADRESRRSRGRRGNAIGQRLRRRVVEGADGAVLLSGQHPQRHIPPLGGRRGARHLDRPQGRGRRRQGDGGVRRRMPEKSRGGRRGEARFKEEISATEYKSLLPADQKPPVELNRVTMEKFRPAMSEHYVKERPEFS